MLLADEPMQAMEESMGFSMSLILYLPEMEQLKDEHGNVRGVIRVWYPHAGTTAYLTWGSGYNGEDRSTGRTLAMTCIIAWIYTKLIPKRNIPPLKEDFAPHFAYPEDLPDFATESGLFVSPSDWLRNYIAKCKDDQEYIYPVWDLEKKTGVPEASSRLKHNQLMALDGKALKRHLILEGYDPLWKMPFMWAPASRVANWLKELEAGGNHASYRALKTDRAALAHVRAMRSYFEELGHIGNKVLFCFNEDYPFGNMMLF